MKCHLVCCFWSSFSIAPNETMNCSCKWEMKIQITAREMNSASKSWNFWFRVWRERIVPPVPESTVGLKVLSLQWWKDYIYTHVPFFRLWKEPARSFLGGITSSSSVQVEAHRGRARGTSEELWSAWMFSGQAMTQYILGQISTCDISPLWVTSQ